MSGWSTLRVLELCCYACCIVVSFALVPRVCAGVWQQECSSNRLCRRFLRRSWLGGAIDLADDQWRELRENLPLLFAALIGHTLLSLLVRRLSPKEEQQTQQPIELSERGARQQASRASCVEQDRVSGVQKRSSTTIAVNTTATASLSSPQKPHETSSRTSTCLPLGTLGRRRAAFNVGTSIVFLTIMHGAHAFFPIALVCASFTVGHATKGTRFAAPLAWVLAVGMIWLKERWHAAPFLTFAGLMGRGIGSSLDGFRGLHPWRLSFNLAILRVVSFNLDLHWAELQKQRAASSGAMDGQGVGGTGKDGADEPLAAAKHKTIVLEPHDYSARVLAHRPLAEYSLWHCLGYVFYAPLYLAGPTLTFNAYVSQMACPQRSYDWKRLAFYIARLLFALCLLEAGLHTLPVFALARAGSLNFSPGVLACFIYVILKLMWLKFLVIWRLFRLWALCDGVEPPENMQRCMSNNYSVANFWKGWHCRLEAYNLRTPGPSCAPSDRQPLTQLDFRLRTYFNRWLVRYIYVPLGGANTGRWWNVFVVFIFVAFWHDVEPKLFMWGLLNGVFLVLEALIRGFYRKTAVFERLRSNPTANRLIQGLGATSSIMVLLLVNLIGYTVGIAGTQHLVDKILLARDGQITIAVSFAVLFSGVQIMFATEDARKRSTHSSAGYRKVAQS